MNSPRASRPIMISSFMNFFFLLTTLSIGYASNDALWCYECNADLSDGRKNECNTPYSAPSSELVACPTNESYVCLKSLIFYRNVHATVRGCVPSSEKDGYCSFKEAYPEANLECLFCNDYACNESTMNIKLQKPHIVLASIILIVISSLITA